MSIHRRPLYYLLRAAQVPRPTPPLNTGSVLQAAGDISLVANTAINSIATLTAASYATLRSQQEANISTLQSQVVSVKPAYDIALTQPSSISSAAAITTYNSAINNLQIAQTNFQQLIDTYSGGKITLSGSGLRSESNIMVSAADIIINSVANSKLARNVNYTNSTSCSWLGLVCNTTTTTATTQKLEENLKGGDVTSLGDLSIFALGNRDPSGNLFTESGNFLVLGANKSKISSDVGHIQLTAANDIAIEANQSRHSQLTNAQTSSQSSFIFIPITNSSNLALDAGAQYTAEGSTVTANSIQIRSGRDTLVRGSILSADRDIQIVTGRDIDIVEARDLVSYQTIRDSKKSGLFNNGDGLFGITLGSTSTTQASSTTIDTASASQIASIAGGISIFGGRNVLLQGADMTAGMNIDIIGDNVSIMAAKNVYNQEDSYKARTSGLTLALKGAALGHFESAWQASQKSKRAEDSRLKAAYDFKAGYDLYRAVRETPDLASLNKGFNDLLSGNPTTALQATGINLELSLGSSSITSSAVQKQTDWRATNLFSNGDTTIIARSPVVGQTGVGKLDIMGSNLDANNITISAGTSLSARNSVQTTVSRETSSNTSASVGVGLGTQGLYATASGQIGNTLGQAFKEDNGESHLTASNKLTLLSGGNVDLKGAVARASRIETDIAGSLTVTSLQDSERYQYKSSNAGGSISVPIYGGTSTPSGSINSSTQNISNQYQSVVQQSGLFAGDNGFSIKVGGLTNLVGGAIISSAPVTMNQIITGDLSYSDLSNNEQTSVSGYTFGLGTGAGSNYITPVPNLGGVNRNSITQSVVSSGTIQFASYAPRRAVLTNQQNVLQTQISNLTQQLIGYPAAQTAAAQSQAKLDYYVNAINYYFSTPNPSPANYYINLYNLEKANLIQLQSSLVTYQNTQTLLTAAQNSLATTSANISALDGMVPTLTTRTIATANSSLNNTFDIAKTRNAIEAMAVFSETAMRAVGDSFQAPIDVAQKKIADSTVALNVAKQSGNATAVAAAQTTLDNANASLDTLRGQQILAHGIVGGLTATLGGTNPTTGFVGGVAGKTVALVATDILAKSNIDPQSVLYQQLITLAATAAGSITGGTTGGFIASQGDRFNRQLHISEQSRIKQLANGDPQKEARLTAAACALIKCYAEYPTDSLAYQELKKFADIGTTFTTETSILSTQKYDGEQMFGYSGYQSIKDAAKNLSNTYQASSRAWGALQAGMGTAGIYASFMAIPTCITIIGCAGVTGGLTISTDSAYAGFKQLIYGDPQSTQLNQALLTLGLTPQAAGIVEFTLGVGTGAAMVNGLSKASAQALATNTTATASSQAFKPLGITVTPSVLASTDAQALYQAVKTGNPTLETQTIRNITNQFIESGTTIPTGLTASDATVLLKFVPKGWGVNDSTGYFVSLAEGRKLSTMEPAKIADLLALPPENTKAMLANGFDLYQMTPKAGQNPTVFLSKTAPSNTGANGGANQTIVPNRLQWNAPIPININQP
ncbi:MAG: hemagglutinin repeat-containing protein [Leptothrix ochracea]|uniref:hemagglutinin repeat-containing protein n=1 Tax=Leptothrix ochracea TaxID=735331 RepID=UPI0034E2B27D